MFLLLSTDNKMPFDLTAFEKDEIETETVKTKKPRKKKEAPAKSKTAKTRARPLECKLCPVVLFE